MKPVPNAEWRVAIFGLPWRQSAAATAALVTQANEK
jgi:hypothetical protein